MGLFCSSHHHLKISSLLEEEHILFSIDLLALLQVKKEGKIFCFAFHHIGILIVKKATLASLIDDSNDSRAERKREAIT